jgi:Tol biopolymer transport system component
MFDHTPSGAMRLAVGPAGMMAPCEGMNATARAVDGIGLHLHDPAVPNLMPRLAVIVVLGLVGLLAPSSAAAATPRGRNGLIAFVHHTYSGEVSDGIAVVRPDGRGRRMLTRDSRDRSPAWSPDGKWLAFERAGRIYVIEADGTGLRRLTTGGQPTWSPDGRQIAFDDGQSLFVMRVKGGRVRRLYRAADNAYIDGLTWSPDGRRIAFSLVEEFGDNEPNTSIVMINRQGGDLKHVTDCSYAVDFPEPRYCWGPDWSPDGSRIAFTGTVWLCDECDQDQAFVTNLDGSDVHWIKPDTLFTEAEPSWSPDGTRLVAEVNGGLAILNLAGALLREVDPMGSEPAWQPRR